MAKLTNIEVAKFLAKRSKADRNFIEMAARDFRKGAKKGKRRKASKKASAAPAPARKSAPKKKASARPSRPSPAATAPAPSEG